MGTLVFLNGFCKIMMGNEVLVNKNARLVSGCPCFCLGRDIPESVCSRLVPFLDFLGP